MPSLEIKVTDAQEEELSEKPNKRLFIGLVMGTSALICLILALLWLVPYVGLTTIHPVAPKIFGNVDKASITRAKQDIRGIEGALDYSHLNWLHNALRPLFFESESHHEGRKIHGRRFIVH